MYINLGNVLTEIDRFEEAAEAYGQAIALAPGLADAHSNLGVLLRGLGRFAEAEEQYRAAIAADPDHADAYDNLGRLLAGTGRIDEAIKAHARAIELRPRGKDSRRFLVAAHAAVGETDKALAVLDEWLTFEPDSDMARHLRAAISGENVPPRASDGFVEQMFDRFANSFDARLASLHYRAPRLVAEAVQAALGPPSGTAQVLDAGCGTGLCGPFLAPYAAELDGVDLSGQMLEKAQRRKCYDQLVKEELTAYLAARPDAYDLVVSADTLCYFGRLEEVSAAAAAALRPDGLFIFTLEAERGGAPMRLNPHGRYSHDEAYVVGALTGAGLHIETIGHNTLRMEKGEPVAGLIVTARRERPAGAT